MASRTSCRWIVLLAGILMLLLAAAARAQMPIVVATYNLRLDLAEDGPNAWPQRREMVKGLIRFHGFDLFGTQEGLPNQITDLEALAEYGRVGVGRDDGKSAGEHSAIFYRRARFELLGNGDFWLSATPERPSKGWDGRCCNRLASWARLRDRQGGRRFTVLCAHFDHEGAVARRESARLMLRKAAEIGGSEPVIVLGDFNATPDSEPVAILRAALRDAREISATPPYGPVGTFNGFKLAAPMRDRIDYVFVGTGVRVLKYGVLSDNLDGRFPSDHHPVVVTLDLP